MKTTTKINVLTTAWILLILIFINIVVFYLFMTTTVNIEKSALFQKAGDILEDINIKDSTVIIDEKLKTNLTSHSFIRIIKPDGKVSYQVTNDLIFAKKMKSKYTKERESQRSLITINNNEKQVLIVRIPIKTGNQISGTLEIGEQLLGLESRKDILIWIMGICTILAALLSLLGGSWLSNMIMRPISNMITTMEDIEQSGVPKKINIKLDSKDELQKLAKTFNRMIDRIEETMEKQSQFVSDASHELKTPLTIIKSYANFLRRHGLQDRELAEEAIQAIHSEATRMQKMTETFLDLAALEKKQVLELNEVDLVSLIINIQKQLKEVYRREITLNYKDSPLTILADELKIKQVIIILLDNAMKYSNDKIEVFIEKKEKQAVILVKDHGIGIPQEEIENIFERFYRVDKARSRETGGTGLGLHIAKSIVKLHKGIIKINSKEGLGTEVQLLFPLKDTEGGQGQK